MALGDPYATIPELEARLGRADDGTFAEVLDAASRDVEQFCHRQFNRADVATARTYRPLDGCLTFIDDFHTTTDLVVATDGDNDGAFETTWTTAEYEVAPADGVASGAGGWPFWQLVAVSGRFWPVLRRRTVQVAAQWGWVAVPTAIKRATLNVAEQVVLEGSSSGPVRSEAIDGYSVSYATGDRGIQFGEFEDLGPLAPAGPYRRFEGFA